MFVTMIIFTVKMYGYLLSNTKVYLLNKLKLQTQQLAEDDHIAYQTP